MKYKCIYKMYTFKYIRNVLRILKKKNNVSFNRNYNKAYNDFINTSNIINFDE